MHTLDAKMALWREVYARLKEARERYKVARGKSEDDPELSYLASEVDRLQRACGVALSAMQEELAKLKTPGDSGRDSQ